MIGGRRLRKTIPTVKYVACPDCGKHRLPVKVNDDGTTPEVSSESYEVRGEARYENACEFCQNNYEKSDQRFLKDNLKKIQKSASMDREDLQDSDHNDFSLDV